MPGRILSQKALMREVEELTKQIAAQSLKLADRSKAMDAQSAQAAEQAAKLAALEEASEDAHTREHRSSSPARQDAYSCIDNVADKT